MLEFLKDSRNHNIMEEELIARGVKCMNFYDVLIDFILLDAFEEVEKPPPPIRAIIQNRWISASFRETVSTHFMRTYFNFPLSFCLLMFIVDYF